MRLEPVITEKSLELANKGKYTFRVDRRLNKHQIRNLIEKVFKVKVTRIATIKTPGEVKTTLRRQKRIVQPGKKAIVSLKEGDKIALFEKAKK